MAKRGQYFTIDAFSALLVVAVGLILILAVNSYAPSSAQPQILSQEFVNSLAQTKIKDVNNPFVTQQVTAGNISDSENTILQQAYEFKLYFDSFLAGCQPADCHGYEPLVHTNMSAELLASVTQKLVPEQYNFEIIMDGDTVHGKGAGQGTTNMLVSSKRIIFGVVNKTVEFWGPVTVEVRVWQ